MKNKNAVIIAVCILATAFSLTAEAQSWSITGNLGTNAATDFVGTKDAINFKIRTNNTVRMNFTSNGKVGIGNFTPVFKLDVKGGSINTDSLYRIFGVKVLSRTTGGNIQVGDGSAFVGIGTSSPTQKLEVTGTIFSTSGGFKFPDGSTQTTAALAGANTLLSNLGTTAVNASIIPNTTNTVALGSASKKWSGIYSAYADVKNSTSLAATFDGGSQTYIRWMENGASRGYLGSYTGNGPDVDFGTSSGNPTGSVHLTLQGVFKEFTLAPYGEIGIGTTAPQAKLHINHNSILTDPQLFLYENENDFARLNFGNNTTSDIWSIAGLPSQNPANALLNFYHSTAGNVMSLNGNGSVSIGTETPATGYLLSVAGKAICTEMKVQLQANWPDYVFDEDYTLMKLEDLKIHLKNNKHLPGLPSAAEVEKDQGFEIGCMQQKLLEKVEELTLYIINQQDEINLLKAKLESIK